MNNNSKTNKIKVLECIRQGQVGGGESHLVDLSTTLNKDEFEPIALSFTDGPMVETLRNRGIKTYVIHTESGFDFKIWKQVQQLLKAENIDIVHAHGTRANSNTFWSAKQLGIPFVYTVHGWSFHQDQSPIIRKIRETIEKLLTNESDVTISVSFNNQKDGIDRFSMPRSKVIYYGINMDKFDINRKYENLRKEWKIPEGKTIVGFLVRMTIQKDPHTMIRAIQKVLEKTKDIYFVMIGEGDLKKSTLDLAKELNVESNIIFENFRLDIPNVLNSIDIYCLPSLWEGMPIGLIEAMSMKKAIIASPVDGTKEAIVDEVTGLLVPEQKPELLAEAILRLNNDKKLLAKISYNAYRFAQRKFDTKRMTKEIENIYKKVLVKNKINPLIKFKIKVKKIIPFFLGKKIRGSWQRILGIYFIGNKYYCPYCNNHFRKFMPAGVNIPIYNELNVVGAGYRKNSICPRCFSTDRDRLIYLYLTKKINIQKDKYKILHISPEPSIKSILRNKKNIDYVLGENYKDKYFFNKDFLQLDITNLYYEDDAFDIVIANHTLQYINNDQLAMEEIYRVLKPNGKAILQVPISYENKRTIEDEFFILPRIKEKHFFNYEKVRLYGTDYFTKLEKIGFKIDLINPIDEDWLDDINKLAINPSEKIIIATKASIKKE